MQRVRDTRVREPPAGCEPRNPGTLYFTIQCESPCKHGIGTAPVPPQLWQPGMAALVTPTDGLCAGEKDTSMTGMSYLPLASSVAQLKNAATASDTHKPGTLVFRELSPRAAPGHRTPRGALAYPTLSVRRSAAIAHRRIRFP